MHVRLNTFKQIFKEITTNKGTQQHNSRYFSDIPKFK